MPPLRGCYWDESGVAGIVITRDLRDKNVEKELNKSLCCVHVWISQSVVRGSEGIGKYEEPTLSIKRRCKGLGHPGIWCG
jgi:hypothetical protein